MPHGCEGSLFSNFISIIFLKEVPDALTAGDKGYKEITFKKIEKLLLYHTV